MDLAEQLLTAAGIVAPGFVAIKLFDVFGAQRQRAQWEWTAWSVGISLPIAWLARAIAPEVSARTGLAADVTEVIVAMILAVLIAGIGIWLWRTMKRSDHDRVVAFRRAVTDSAWDEVMDDALAHERWLEVITAGTEREQAFRGWLSTAGREDTKAEPWLYLRRVQRQATLDGPFEEMPGTHGLLIHRDHIRRVRVFYAEGENAVPVELESGAEAEPGRPTADAAR